MVAAAKSIDVGSASLKFGVADLSGVSTPFVSVSGCMASRLEIASWPDAIVVSGGNLERK